MAHLSPKHREPLRNSLMPSRRHCRQAAARYRANALSSLHPTPLGRTAPVVRNRRHVTNRGDLEAHRLERPDGRLPARSGSPHEHLDLLEPQVHGLARGVLRGGLRREGRALARALEAYASRTRPRDHVAHLVGEGDDGVVEGRLHMRYAHADFLALALSPTLLGRGGGRRRGGGRHRLLLDHDALALALTGAGVRVGALPAHGQPFAMTYAAVAPDVHEALHAHGHLAPQIAFHLVLALDDVAHPRGLLVRPRLHALARIHPGVREDPPGGRDADPVDVLDRHFPALVPRQVHSGNACHGCSFPSYPWRCLWRGFLQMMCTRPARRTTLQCSHRTFTDGLTFMMRPFS